MGPTQLALIPPPAVNQAIYQAISAGQPLGMICFPRGNFKIASRVPASPLTGSNAKTYQLTLMGTGGNAPVISIYPGGSITLISPGAAPYHGGAPRDFTLNCVSSNLTGITTQVARGIKWTNMAIENCATGVDM